MLLKDGHGAQRAALLPSAASGAFDGKYHTVIFTSNLLTPIHSHTHEHTLIHTSLPPPFRLLEIQYLGLFKDCRFLRGE